MADELTHRGLTGLASPLQGNFTADARKDESTMKELLCRRKRFRNRTVRSDAMTLQDSPFHFKLRSKIYRYDS